MSIFIFGTLSGLVIAGCAGIYAKQSLIEDARSGTDGYF